MIYLRAAPAKLANSKCLCIVITYKKKLIERAIFHTASAPLTRRPCRKGIITYIYILK